jgi:sporulation protein YlmC with PRC-barrel domain
MPDLALSALRGADDFHFGASVYAADGRHLGALQYVIVESESFDVHAIVVRETPDFAGHHRADAALLEEDVAVPISAVSDVSRDRITLSISAAEVRRSQPYLTYHYAPIAGRDTVRSLVLEAGQSPSVPGLVEDAHKRLDELEIRAGENVMLGHSGRRLGTVRDVVLDHGELAGIVIHPQGFFKEDVFLQVRFLGRSDDMSLFAQLSEGDIGHLQPFRPAPPA